MLKYLILLLLITQSAIAYEATNFTGTKEEVRELFNSIWGKFKNFDNYHCYRRAHIISYQLKLRDDINTMKVFFFKGTKLDLPMNWYYHVAPMTYYQGEGVVLDKGLFEGAIHLKDWLDAFGEGKACKEIYSMDEYRQLKPQEYCMYMIVPMYYYSPADLENLNLEDFNNSELQDMLFSLPQRLRKTYRASYPLN